VGDNNFRLAANSYFRRSSSGIISLPFLNDFNYFSSRYYRFNTPSLYSLSSLINFLFSSLSRINLLFSALSFSSFWSISSSLSSKYTFYNISLVSIFFNSKAAFLFLLYSFIYLFDFLLAYSCNLEISFSVFFLFVILGKPEFFWSFCSFIVVIYLFKVLILLYKYYLFYSIILIF